MIGKLATVLGLDEQGLLSAIKHAAGSSHYASGYALQFIEYNDFGKGTVENADTGWAAGLVCGPRELVAGRISGPVGVRFTFPRGDDDPGRVLLRSPGGVEVEVPLPQAALRELIG